MWTLTDDNDTINVRAIINTGTQQDELRHHPQVQGALWATRTCKGLVKL